MTMTTTQEEATRRAELVDGFGAAWDTMELTRDFEVHSFMAPFVMVTRRVDGVRGTMQFDHRPRFYYDFKPSEKD